MSQKSMIALRSDILDSVGAAGKAAAIQALRGILTEDNTDLLIERLQDQISSRLPWYLKWVPVGPFLDSLLPEALLELFEELLA